MTINLVPLRFSNSWLLEKIISGIQEVIKCEVLIRPLNIDLEESFSEGRGQYFSTQIIASAIKEAEHLDGKVLILTEADLFVPVLTFIFGEAQLSGKHSIVSVCRLHEEFYSGITDDTLLLERSMKEVLHELGHNFGLKHCIDWDCVMHSSPGIEEVDIKGKSYCSTCIKHLT